MPFCRGKSPDRLTEEQGCCTRRSVYRHLLRHYGFTYRKHTRIWHSMGDYLQLRPMCSSRDPCDIFKALGERKKSAQRAPAKTEGEQIKNDSCSLNQLHSTPPHLCDDIALAADLTSSINDTRHMIEVLLNIPSQTSEEGGDPNQDQNQL